MKNKEKPKSYAKSILAILFFIVFVDMIGISIVIPILAPLFINNPTGLLAATTSIHLRTILLGLLIAIYPLAQFFGAPLWGALADRHGRKPILLISLIGTFIGYVVFAIGIITSNIYLLFFSRLLDGFTGGNISIALSSIADISDKKSKAKNFGLVGMAFGLGFIIGPFIGGRLSDSAFVSWFSFATPIWFAAILSFFNILSLIFLYKETIRKKVHTPVNLATGPKNVIRAFKLVNIRVLLIFSFMILFGFNFFTQFFPVYLIDKFSFTQTQIGNLFAYIGLCVAITQGIVIRIATKKFTAQKIISYSAILLSIALILIIALPMKYHLFIILPFTALFFGLTQPTTSALISNASSQDSQGEILGISQSMQSLAQAIPPIIAGFIISIDISLPITIAAESVFLAWVVFMIFYVLKKKREAKFKEI
jgi:MFS transporter, DHA1 family, tetracycline resistance protein